MAVHPLAGKPARSELLIEPLRQEYYARKPNITDSAQRNSNFEMCRLVCFMSSVVSRKAKWFE